MKYRIRIVRGQLSLKGIRVRALVEHDHHEILVSSRVPAPERPALIRFARRIARRDAGRPGACFYPQYRPRKARLLAA